MTDKEVDKKKSKLGYQRIQLACVHCRRRKIRCVLDPDGPRDKCDNCIRLKKDCQFVEVDQQELAKKPSRSSGVARAGSASSSILPPSSPDLGEGRILDEQDEYGGFPASTTHHGLPVEPENMLHNQGPFTNVEHGYQPMTETRQSRSNDRYGPHMANVGPTTSSQVSEQYWRQNQHGSGGDYAPFPTDPIQYPQTSQSAHAYGYRNQRVDQAWHQQQHPLRSISQNQFENQVPYAGSSYVGGYHENARHDASYIGRGPPSVDVQNASMMGHGQRLRPAPPRQSYETYANQSQPYQAQTSHQVGRIAHVGSQNPYTGDWYSNPPPFKYEQVDDDED